VGFRKGVLYPVDPRGGKIVEIVRFLPLHAVEAGDFDTADSRAMIRFH
jgi:hypothetical protein